LRVIFGFGDSFGYSIVFLHLAINRREDAASAIICFVHFRRVRAVRLAVRKRL